MATGRVPTTANSPLTAKGDLFTYSTAPARLAVGNDGETIVADSSTSTGLRWQGDYAAGKNKIINGDMNINQRNFTSNSSGYAFGLDRWAYISSGGTATYSAQTFTPGTAPVAGYEAKNFARLVTSGQSASSDFCVIVQGIEGVRTFAGQTVTISFWAKAGSGTPSIIAQLEQSFGSGGSSSVQTIPAAATVLSTSWARYTATVNVPSISGKTVGTSDALYLYMWVSAGTGKSNNTNNLISVQNNTFDIWGVQVEAGSVATAFQTATGTIQGELAACQRYYQRYKADSAFDDLGYSGKATSSTVIYANRIPFVPFRTVPSSVDFANVTYISSWGAGTTAVSAIALSSYTSADTPLLTFTTTGLTVGTTYILLAGNTSDAYIGLSAEL